jgi:hypothetical protein
LKAAFELLSRCYAVLAGAYPYEFRRAFAREMGSVFQEALEASMARGRWAPWRAFWKELVDWPAALLTEYWFAFSGIFRRGIMSLIAEDKTWGITERRDAVVASLPSLLFGTGIALGALVIWEPWYAIPPWRLWTGVAIGLVPAVIVALGGFLAIIRNLPAWGYTWAGGAVMGAIAFVKALAEDRADFGLPLLSPILDLVLAALLLVGISVLTLVAAWRGWRQAGLTSLGFATMAGMSSFSMATAAPFNRYDLALLAAPVGVCMSLLTYLYVRKGDAGRFIAICVYEVMNALVFMLIAGIWNLHPDRPSPVVPFLVVLTGALLVGPVAGMIGIPLRRVVKGS